MEWMLCHLWPRFRTLNMAKNWRIEVRATAAEHWVSPRSTLGKVKGCKLNEETHAQWRNISGLIPNTFPPLVALFNPSPSPTTSMWPGIAGLMMTPGVQWQDSWWPLVSNDRTHDDHWCPFRGCKLCAQWRNVPGLILYIFPALVRLFNPTPDDPQCPFNPPSLFLLPLILIQQIRFYFHMPPWFWSLCVWILRATEIRIISKSVYSIHWMVYSNKQLFYSII